MIPLDRTSGQIVNSTKRGRIPEANDRSSPDVAGFCGPPPALSDHVKNWHWGRTPRTDQRVDFVDLGDEPGPGAAVFAIRNSRFFTVSLCRIRAVVDLRPTIRQGQTALHRAYTATCPLCGKNTIHIAGDTAIHGVRYDVSAPTRNG